MLIKSYGQALKYLEHLPRTEAAVFKGQAGLKRSKLFFEQLANPQNQLRVIHIAGTSGKGSTAMFLSAVLTAHGHKVGMALSPHVYDIRERCQINNQLISKPEFILALNQVIPAIKFLHKQNVLPSYFEVMIAIALVVFANKGV